MFTVHKEPVRRHVNTTGMISRVCAVSTYYNTMALLECGKPMYTLNASGVLPTAVARTFARSTAEARASAAAWNNVHICIRESWSVQHIYGMVYEGATHTSHAPMHIHT